MAQFLIPDLPMMCQKRLITLGAFILSVLWSPLTVFAETQLALNFCAPMDVQNSLKLRATLDSLIFGPLSLSQTAVREEQVLKELSCLKLSEELLIWQKQTENRLAGRPHAFFRKVRSYIDPIERDYFAEKFRTLAAVLSDKEVSVVYKIEQVNSLFRVMSNRHLYFTESSELNGPLLQFISGLHRSDLDALVLEKSPEFLMWISRYFVSSFVTAEELSRLIHFWKFVLRVDAKDFMETRYADTITFHLRKFSQQVEKFCVELISAS